MPLGQLASSSLNIALEIWGICPKSPDDDALGAMVPALGAKYFPLLIEDTLLVSSSSATSEYCSYEHDYLLLVFLLSYCFDCTTTPTTTATGDYSLEQQQQIQLRVRALLFPLLRLLL